MHSIQTVILFYHFCLSVCLSLSDTFLLSSINIHEKKRNWSKLFVAGCPSCCQPAGITCWTLSFLYLLRLPNREGASLPLRLLPPTPVLWPMKVKHELKMNRSEMSMIRWMCGVKLNERKKSEELWELLGLEPVSLMIKKSRLRWFGHV